MPTPLELLIRRQLASYLRGEIPLSEFNDWFVPATWDVDQEVDRPAYDLTNEIYLRLAEYSNGDWTEAELKDQLRPQVEALAVAE